MIDINVESEAEKLYNALLKIEERQKKKICNDANDFTFHAVDRCLRGRYAR